ncbi:MAG: Ig-like domain repeat protein [Rudaea sp.]|uniref:beta strand repeat-containing protein n=1 Tax=Rudaea sp. TaxID=2136325 RepID=UPI0039E247BF
MRKHSFALRAACVTLLIATSPAVQAATYTVSNTGDSGAGSLRQAIVDANAGGAGGTIVFAIPAATDAGCGAASGVCTIKPAFDLPAITQGVVLDGYTQPGAQANTNTVESRQGLNGALKIELDCAMAGTCIAIDATDVTVKGLVINGFSSFGIDVAIAGGTATIAGNYIGTNVAGTAVVAGSAQTAIDIRAGSAGSVMIGGTTAAARNLLSGNEQAVFSYSAMAPTIQGNLLGTDASGTASLTSSGNTLNLNPVGVAAIVGGTAAGAGNLIWNDSGAAGAPSAGVFISGGIGDLVQGNLIGTDVAGTHVIAHASSHSIGIWMTNAQSSFIGATTPGGRNVIAGFPGGGIEVDALGVATGGSNRVVGNFIGTDISGSVDLGNAGIGVQVGGNAMATIGGSDAGASNIIAFTKTNGTANSGIGVGITAGNGNPISRNAIFGNAALGIDLGLDGVTSNDTGDADSGANALQNFPVVSASIAGGTATISGTINSSASAALHLEFFANSACSDAGYGQGQAFIGSTDVTTDGSGNATFGGLSLTVPGALTVITATATDAAGNTSEFSKCPAAAAGASSTTLISSLNPSVVGQSVTFTATVAGNAPTGTVQFKDGGINLGAAVALAGASATLVTNSLAAGTHPISAVYSGDGGNTGSTSAVVEQIVNSTALTPTQTTLASSLNPSTPGHAVTFSATVGGALPDAFDRRTHGTAVTPAAISGTVQFKDGATNLGGPMALAGGMATLTTSSLAVGSHAITATYSGDATYAGSVSLVLTQVVNAVVAPPALPPVSAPTLSPWSVWLLALSLAAGAASARRSQARARTCKPGR